MDVSDRRMQVQLTQEAKIASDFLYIRAIFAVAGFVSALKRVSPQFGRRACALRRRKRRRSAADAYPDAFALLCGAHLLYC